MDLEEEMRNFFIFLKVLFWVWVFMTLLSIPFLSGLITQLYEPLGVILAGFHRSVTVPLWNAVTGILPTNADKVNATLHGAAEVSTGIAGFGRVVIDNFVWVISGIGILVLTVALISSVRRRGIGGTTEEAANFTANNLVVLLILIVAGALLVLGWLYWETVLPGLVPLAFIAGVLLVIYVTRSYWKNVLEAFGIVAGVMVLLFAFSGLILSPQQTANIQEVKVIGPIVKFSSNLLYGLIPTTTLMLVALGALLALLIIIRRQGRDHE